MPSKHKHRPVSLRLPEASRAWLFSYAEDQGLAVNAVLVLALAEFKAQRESTATPEQRQSQ